MQTQEEIKEYHKEYRKKHAKEIAKYNKEYVKNNKEEVMAYRKQWAKEHPELRKATKYKSRENVRVTVLRMIAHGNPICENCGCDDIRMLEINHINGGGYQDTKECKGSRFYQRIKQGKRQIDDLNILCRVCNALHALELKLGKLPMEITWKNKT